VLDFFTPLKLAMVELQSTNVLCWKGVKYTKKLIDYYSSFQLDNANLAPRLNKVVNDLNDDGGEFEGNFFTFH